ncbi:hypothetical protein Q0590_08410 [Rhodocytophaga aerolata]|uniref:Ribbon-helix-helix protein, CopG family n=1 Tax=Rhodocytophaga aerolata TaxID=455078 RepID=A0ABT8R2E9_9BACT|nr:hypothetical protein [Rhodocytophaga aerolata]MDO1446271.1 hypothetical protein [Rhodocytophaga aerolata]
MARPKVDNPKVSRSIRLTEKAVEKGEEVAREKGFSNLSDFLRSLLMREIDEFEKRKNSQ